jgi:hypothetical protein
MRVEESDFDGRRIRVCGKTGVRLVVLIAKWCTTIEMEALLIREPPSERNVIIGSPLLVLPVCAPM